MTKYLGKFAVRLIMALAIAAILSYAAGVVAYLNGSREFSTIVGAAALLAVPVLLVKLVGLKVTSRWSRPREIESRVDRPLLGIELRLPDYQCAAYPELVAALVGEGARVVATEPEEFLAVGSLVPRTSAHSVTRSAMFAVITEPAIESETVKSEPAILTLRAKGRVQSDA